ncbi:MAG: SDR family NAD(P)-dependent oxidoreductase [Pirellulaceae bacterium]
MTRHTFNTEELVTAERTRLQDVFDHDQPVVVVTGSKSPRVGRAVAEYFDWRGCRTVLHGRRAKPGDSVDPSPTESKPLELVGNIEEERQVEKWVSQVTAAFGRVDVLVNCAAIWEPKSLEETRAEDFEHFFRVNSMAPALASKHFGLQMTKQSSGGAILNVGDWAVTRPYTNFAAYLQSKGSIETLTRCMAVELASRNPRVRVNAILPGPVLLDASIDSEREQVIANSCLLKRSGTADDVAHAAYFLATSPFITGVSLPVDGGRSVHAGDSTDVIAHPEVK